MVVCAVVSLPSVFVASLFVLGPSLAILMRRLRTFSGTWVVLFAIVCGSLFGISGGPLLLSSDF